MSTVLGVFAHPDDEAFGPSGTLAILAKKNPVYLICVTDGDAGENHSSQNRDLGEIRREELEASARVLGIKKVFFLHYKDGSLNNNLYHEIAAKIQQIFEEIKPDTVITVEMRGQSGHLDHIAVSMVTSFVFEKLNFVKEIWYYCKTEAARKLVKDYYIYFPPGYKESEISKVVDISSVWDQKVKAINMHESQSKDARRHLEYYDLLPKEENFIIYKKL